MMSAPDAWKAVGNRRLSKAAKMSHPTSGHRPSPPLSPRRLLTVFPSRARGGAEDYAVTIARAAISAGWDVHAAFPIGPGTEALDTEFALSSVQTRHLDIEEATDQRDYEYRSLVRNARNAWRTARILHRVRPDVVHLVLPWPTFGYGTLMAVAALRYPTVVTFQLVTEEGVVSSRRQAAYARMRAKRQTWVTTSEFSRRHLQRMFGVPSHEVVIIPNGVSLSTMEAPGPRLDIREEVRRELHIPMSARLLLTVGRLSRQKGHALLIPAIEHIVREHPDVRFVWVGDGEDRAVLSAALAAAGVSAHVIMTGQRRDVARLMAAADLFVFPTLSEGLPFTLLEAMASGLPVVTSDASSIPEIVEHDRQGLLFAAGSVPALRAAVLNALRNEARMVSMAAAAKDRVAEFSEDAMTRHTLALFDRATVPGRLGAHPSEALR